MRETFKSIPAEVRSYKALYKGQRYWIFENDFSRPFEYYADPDYHQILLYDALVGGIISAGRWTEKGEIHGCVMWGQGVDFICDTPREMISQTERIAKWYH